MADIPGFSEAQQKRLIKKVGWMCFASVIMLWLSVPMFAITCIWLILCVIDPSFIESWAIFALLLAYFVGGSGLLYLFRKRNEASNEYFKESIDNIKFVLGFILALAAIVAVFIFVMQLLGMFNNPWF